MRGAAVALGVALFVGAALRLVVIERHGLWIDDAFSWWFSRLPLSVLWTQLAAFETHPPVYYTLLKGARSVLGESEIAMRMPSLAGGLAVVVLAWLGAFRLRGPSAAAWAAGIAGCAALAIEMSWNVRQYTLLSAAVGVMAVALCQLAPKPLAAAEVVRWDSLAPVAFGVGVCATLWLHNIGVVYVACATGALAILWWSADRAGRQAATKVALGGAAGTVLWLPWIPALLNQSRSIEEGWHMTIPSPEQWLTLALDGLLFRPVWFGPFDRSTVAVAIACSFVGLLAVAWRKAARECWRPSILVPACLALGPLLMLSVVTLLWKPVLGDRILSPMAVPAAILGAIACSVAWRRWWTVLPAGLLMAVLLRGAVYESVQRPYSDWREISRQVEHAAERCDRLFAIPNYAAIPLDYYRSRGLLKTGIDWIPLPGAFPALGTGAPHVSNRGAPVVTAAVEADVVRLVQQAKAPCVLIRFAHLYDPDGVVQRALERDFVEVDRQEFRGAALRLFRRASTP